MHSPALSHIDKHKPHRLPALAGESSPLAQAFARLALEHGQQPAIHFRDPAKDLQYGFAKLWRRVDRVTGHLQRLGLQRGDRLAWLGLNHELMLVALVACARLGATLLPLNVRLAVPELQRVLQDATPRLLVHDAAHADAAQALMPGAQQRCWVDALIATESPPLAPLPVLSGHEPLLLVYTSGTTGLPKGAVHTQAGVLANARASAWAHGFAPGDKVLSVLPLFHVGGLCIQTLPALLAGVPVVLHPRFDPAAWLADVQALRPTLSLLVPATLRAVFEHPAWASTDLGCLRGVFTGSSTVPLSYLQAFHRRGVPVGQVYGSTETGPVSIVLGLRDAIVREGAAGWPAPECQVKLVDAQGQPVPTGHTGEICVQAPNVMRGYWPGADAQPSTTGLGLHGGWFHTGDLGVCGADGCITVVGRAKDMIISGGENIYPAEIENLLADLPGVAECAVVGLPDERWGEVPVAAIVSAPGASLSEASVLAHLSGRIAKFKLPRRVVLLDALPKSALGKVVKGDVVKVLARP